MKIIEKTQDKKTKVVNCFGIEFTVIEDVQYIATDRIEV